MNAIGGGTITRLKVRADDVLIPIICYKYRFKDFERIFSRFFFNAALKYLLPVKL